MITNVSLIAVYCLDQDSARDFYVEKLGFEVNTDASLNGYRWVTINHPSQPEVEISLMLPGPPLDDAGAAFIRSQLEKGGQGGLGLKVDDCRKTVEEFKAQGVTVIAEPAERPYGVESVIRDDQGNWLVLVEEKDFDPADLS